MVKRKTHEEFIQELNTINPNILVNGKYVDAKTKILCKCKDCGFQWMATPDSLLGSHGCPKCGIKKITGRPKMSQ